jgi:hypothetical protein
VTAVWTGEAMVVVSVPDDAGPATIDRLDPSGDGDWSETVTTNLAEADGPRIEAAYAGGRLAIVHRSEWAGPSSPPVAVAAELFDPDTGELVAMPPPGSSAGSASTGDFPVTPVGGVVVAGDFYLDVATRTWHPLATAPLPPRQEASAVAIGDELYVWGRDQCDELCGTGADVALTDPGEGLVWRR